MARRVRSSADPAGAAQHEIGERPHALGQLLLDRVDADTEPIGRLSRRQPFHLAQPHHLPTAWRKIVDPRLDPAQIVPSDHTAVDGKDIHVGRHIFEICDQFQRHDPRPPRPLRQQITRDCEHIASRIVRKASLRTAERECVDVVQQVENILRHSPVAPDIVG